ncbi:MAG: hypothetical protein DRP15_00150 [Candidatus Aenigmatarchaeota archaeon]|nr:MAG: hypothetical protein DRP15_00150 [Candidatus Aenigmarchaeota archaeon]
MISMFENLTLKQKVIIIPASISICLIVIGILLGDAAVLANLIIISFFISVVPYFLYRYSRFMWIKGLEEQFPNFVRDLADSIRSGMSFYEAINIASMSNYGKLTDEVVKMKNRLSWGTPFLRVMEIFENNVKDSRILTEAIDIIKQSYESGGNIASTLDSVARNIIMLKEAEAERSSLVKQHVFIMYGIFFMFLGISLMIIFVMVPMISTHPGEGMQPSGLLGFGFRNPCENTGMFPCGLFDGICLMFHVGKGIGCYYTALFFTVIIIQGVFIGLIAGQLGENSIIAGTKHSLIMIFVAFGIFFFLAKLGLLPS